MYRSAIKQILNLSSEFNDLSYETIRARTDLGTNYVKAMPRYARGCGLMEPDSFQLTPFGCLAQAHDPELALPVTQWLMHYHLSAPHGPGPVFWHHLVAQVLRPGDLLTREVLAAAIVRAMADAGEKTPGQRALDSSATIFLGTYTKSDGLDGLGLLAHTEERGRYRVTVTPPPPPAAMAAALAAYWPTALGGRKTVDLDALTRPGGFFSLFLLAGEAADEALRSLTRERLIEIFRVAPPHQVARLWEEDDMLLEHLYARP